MAPHAGRRVLVGTDAQLSALLDDLAGRLEAAGAEVRRGPVPEPGRPQVYSSAWGEESVRWADVVVLSSRQRIDNALLQDCDRLIGLVSPSIGLDGVDVPFATGLGVAVAHGAVRENVVSMAEATVMLILMLCYQPRRSEEVLAGLRPRPAPLPSARWAGMLEGRSLGLVGYGRIGREVAQRLSGFGVPLLVASHPGLQAATLPPGASLLPLSDLLERSDIVSLHATAAPGRPPLIDATALALMKPSAYLVNTARGSLVDEAALYAALRDRRIAGAALDNFQVEPLPADSPLRSLDNVILTPHLVGQTSQMYEALLPACVDNVLAILDGRMPPLCRNPEVEPVWRRRLEAKMEHGKAVMGSVGA